MKYAAERYYSDPDKAAHTLINASIFPFRLNRVRAPVHGDQGFRLKATTVSGG